MFGVMRNWTEAALAALFLLLLSGSAYGVLWSDFIGTIKTIDISTREVTLEDGKVYPVQRGINLARFKPGEKVTIHIEEHNRQEMITKLRKGDYIPPPPLKSTTQRRGKL